MKSLIQITLNNTDTEKLDLEVNLFGKENYIKASQSYCAEYEGALVHFRVLFYEDQGSIGNQGVEEIMFESEVEFGASWDKEAHKQYNTFSIKKKSDNQYFPVPTKVLEEIKGNVMNTKWGFPEESQRLEFKFNESATKENKRPYWRVSLQKR